MASGSGEESASGGGCECLSRLLEGDAGARRSDPEAGASHAAEATAKPGKLAPRPLLSEERHCAWEAANFFGARPQQESPVALWILGPSSVGKSTLTAEITPRFGIGVRDVADDPRGGRSRLDAVIIDGEFMRDAHGVYCSWVKTDDWRSAYPALKSIINKEKDSMCSAAASDRRHLVIPQTMLNLDKGLTEVVQLTCQGYTNHVVAVVAPLEECQKRGSSRELETGKRYEPREFWQSIGAIWPVISASNGRYQLVRAVVPAADDAGGLQYQTLVDGRCPPHEDAAAVEAAFEAALRAAVGEPAADAGGARPPTVARSVARCSTASLRLPNALRGDPALAPRPLLDEERSRAWSNANFDGAPSNLEKPVAIWVLGPPHVGKSQLIAQLDGHFRMLEGLEVKGVVVDGNYFRESHGGYRQWTEATSPATAGQAFKSVSDREKDLLCTKASQCRKNIILGRRVTDLNKGLTEIEELKWQGYSNHVLAVVAPREECQLRAQLKGAVSDSFDYDASVRAIPAMIAACNGCYAIVRPEQRPPGDKGPVSFACSFQGRGQGASGSGDSATSLAFSSLGGLRRELDAALA